MAARVLPPAWPSGCCSVGPASPLLAPLMPGRCRHLRRLKRAGLDYWDWVCTDVHSGWGDFMQHVRAQPGEQRLVAFTKFGESAGVGPEWLLKS